MTPVSDANLLCVHIADAPEVQRRVRALMARVECLLAEVEQLTRQNESLRAELAAADNGDGQQDAASLALQQANAYANRH